MTIDDFYKVTPAELYLKMKGFDAKKWEQWEQSRFVAYNVYLSIPKSKGQRTKNIYDFFPLPSDKMNVILRDQNEMQATWEKIKNRNNG